MKIKINKIFKLLLIHTMAILAHHQQKKKPINLILDKELKMIIINHNKIVLKKIAV